VSSPSTVDIAIVVPAGAQARELREALIVIGVRRTDDSVSASDADLRMRLPIPSGLHAEALQRRGGDVAQAERDLAQDVCATVLALAARIRAGGSLDSGSCE
jgi:hypothetical protein